MLEVITGFAALSALILVIIIFLSKTKRTQSVLIFITLLFAFILWSIANYFSLLPNLNSETRIFWIRNVMFITSILILQVAELGNFFPDNKPYFSKFVSYFIRVYFIIISLLSLTPLVIDGVTEQNGNIMPSFGIGMLFYSIGSVSSLGMFGLAMYKKYTKGTYIVRNQILYVTVGLILTGTLGIITNIIFVILGRSDLVKYGPLFVLILLFFTFIALIRYKLFDIRVLFGRIVYFSVLSIFVTIFFYIGFAIKLILFEGRLDFLGNLVAIPFSVVFVILFNQFNKFLQKNIDSRLISPDYNPQEIFTHFNSEVSTNLNYRSIANETINIFARTIRCSFEAIVIIQNETQELVLGKKDLTFDQNIIPHILLIWNIINKQPIILDRLDIEIPVTFHMVETQLKALMEEMRKNGIKLIIPLGQGSQTTGILLLGKKESDLPYNSVELNFITSIADLAGLALARALLYKDAQEFNRNLQRKIEEATQEIREKNIKLEEALSFERDMLDILGHELRTPLGTARNAIVLLQMQLVAGNVSQNVILKGVEIAVENIRREAQLLETILASTKIDNNRLDLKMEKVDAKDVIADSIEANKHEANKKNLKLYSELPDSEVFCNADRLRIQQIIDNFVSNSVKYTKEGEIKIYLQDEDKFVRFLVKDTGVGIPNEELPNLGKKFYRINNYLNSSGKLGDRKIVRPGGTGIGLYVSFQLVRAMGGEVKIDSEIDVGSTFSFTIPKFKEDYFSLEEPTELDKELGKLTQSLETSKARQSGIDPAGSNIPPKSSDVDIDVEGNSVTIK